jgi:hypothetical protein
MPILAVLGAALTAVAPAGAAVVGKPDFEPVAASRTNEDLKSVARAVGLLRIQADTPLRVRRS